MTILNSIELFVGINLFITGLSHFIQPKMWIDFFKVLSSKGNAGNTFNALFHLGFGTFILAFYLVSSFPKILISIYGLLLTLKAFLFLIYPKIGVASIGSVSINKTAHFKWVGLSMVFCSILIFYGLLSN